MTQGDMPENAGSRAGESILPQEEGGGRPQAAHLGGQYPVGGEAEGSWLSPPPACHLSHEPLYEDGPGTLLGLLLWACSQ